MAIVASGGISEALVTTMAGLFTALSGIYFVSDLESRTEELSRRFQAELVKSTGDGVLVLFQSTDDAVTWSSAGTVGFKGSRKGTPFAAQTAAQIAQEITVEDVMNSRLLSWPRRGHCVRPRRGPRA